MLQKNSDGTRPLAELAWLFLKLGTIAFGGPAAHIAMMEDEVVRRRRWLTHEEFLDLLGATNLIPGPNSTEMAIHVGHCRVGWPGLAAALSHQVGVVGPERSGHWLDGVHLEAGRAWLGGRHLEFRRCQRTPCSARNRHRHGPWAGVHTTARGRELKFDVTDELTCMKWYNV